jgi:hypothetical protein
MIYNGGEFEGLDVWRVWRVWRVWESVWKGSPCFGCFILLFSSLLFSSLLFSSLSFFAFFLLSFFFPFLVFLFVRGFGRSGFWQGAEKDRLVRTLKERLERMSWSWSWSWNGMGWDGHVMEWDGMGWDGTIQKAGGGRREPKMAGHSIALFENGLLDVWALEAVASWTPGPSEYCDARWGRDGTI